MADAFVQRRKAPGGDGAEGVGESIEEAHPSKKEEERLRRRQAEIMPPA